MSSKGLEPSVVLIDDNEELLGRLADGLKAALPDEVDIRTWMPKEGENPVEEFERRVDDGTVLVATDYDLTKNGVTGLFGVSIVSWCLRSSIPVGDFSRGNVATLPSEPTLFELRVPPDIEEATAYIASMFRGFSELRDALAGNAALVNMRSPAEVLAALVERPNLEEQFGLYMSRLGASNASLLDRLRPAAAGEQAADDYEKARLLVYVVGHVLTNAVLRYPGPILSSEALCAYVSAPTAEAASLCEIFSEASYKGPFSSSAVFFWRTDVDAVIEREAAALDGDSFAAPDEFNRAVVEKMLGRPLTRHDCTRCNGTRGGYLCPFTHRPVCERPDCSVAANSWIPAGADMCRIERDFYDEWAPLLGL